MYGTTSAGGDLSACNVGCGTVFKFASGGETVLYRFTGLDGQLPLAGVIRDSNGSLYGTTAWGGEFGYGVVFKLDMLGNETVLHSFSGGEDGEGTSASLALDSDGNLYGTTPSGGTNGCGIVFKLDTEGNESVLYSFSGPDGCGPVGNLISDSAGNFYGTTSSGGPGGRGTVFRLTP